MDIMSARTAELEGQWQEHGAMMRLRFNMRSDDTTWWIERIRTYDGVKGDGQYLVYPGLKARTRTPIGEAFEGDLDLRPSEGARPDLVAGARLRIAGLRLTAFVPGTRPAPLGSTGCRSLYRHGLPSAGVTPQKWYVVFAPGGVLEGLDRMTPAEAHETLTELGLCHEFRYHNERWCDPPPAGTFGGIASRLALRGDGKHFVSLDKVIKTMRETGHDMQDKYKETSRGGLATNVIEVPVNFIEC
jgi:hypothetical protein